MRLSFFLIIALMINILIVGIMPDAVGFVQYDTNKFPNQKSFRESNLDSLNDYYTNDSLDLFSSNGTLKDQSKKLSNLTTIGSTGDQVTIGEAFGFAALDYIKVGFQFLKQIFIFAFATNILLFSLAAPMNLYLGLLFTMLEIFALISFVLGR